MVDIKVNDKLIAMYTVGRVADGENGEPNTYVVGRNFPDTRPGQDDRLVTVEHTYEDPVEQLVAAAVMSALGEFGRAERRT